MDVLTALSLAAAGSFCTDNRDAGDWLRTEAAAVAIALNESPQDAIAVALKATTSNDKTATLTPTALCIILNILRRSFLSAIFFKFMLASLATDNSPPHLRPSLGFSVTSRRPALSQLWRARRDCCYFFPLLANAQIDHENSTLSSPFRLFWTMRDGKRLHCLWAQASIEPPDL